MNSCDEFIEKLNRELPDVCTVNDLIKVGIISHRNIMNQFRKKKTGPPFLRISDRKIFYPKPGVLKWLRESSNDNCETQTKNSGKIQNIQSQSELA
jgi:hypothetical protein